MFTLDKLNLADLRLLFLGVNFKVNLGESLRRRIFEYTSSVTKVDGDRLPGGTFFLLLNLKACNLTCVRKIEIP